jgi:hypothetical protein
MIGDAFLNLFANFLSSYLTVVAGILITTGLIILTRRVRLRVSGVCAEGEIIGHHAPMRARVGQMRTVVPIVRFNVGGVAHDFQSVTGGRRKALPIGARVQVRYLGANPKRAEIDQNLRMWIAPASVLALGIACLFAAFQASR